MGMYVPQMQRAWTGYDAGKNIANNLLEAVKMNREYEHKSNVMDMERQRFDIEMEEAKFKREMNLARRKSDDVRLKQNAKRAMADQKLMNWDRKRQKYVNTELADQDWFNPKDWFTGEQDLSDRFKESNAPPVEVEEKPVDYYSSMAIGPDGLPVPPSPYLSMGMENRNPTQTVAETLEIARRHAYPNQQSGEQEYAKNANFRNEVRNYNSLLDITPQGF